MLSHGTTQSSSAKSRCQPCCIDPIRTASARPAGCSLPRRLRLPAIATESHENFSACHHRATTGLDTPRRAVLASFLGVLQLGSPAFATEGVQPLPIRPPVPGDHAPGAAAKPDGKPLASTSAPVESREAPSLSQPAPRPSDLPAAGRPPTAPDRAKPGTSAAQREAQPPAPAADASSKGQPAGKAAAAAPSGAGVPGSKAAPKPGEEGEAKRLLDEEEERRKLRRRKKGRIRELEEMRAELAEKELVLLGKEQELLERDQTVAVLREELELEKKLRTLLTKEKEKAEEEAALAMGLCTGGSIF